MIRIFLINDETQKNNIFFQYLETKSTEIIELETTIVNTKNIRNITNIKNTNKVDKLFSDNCVMCEIQMPEANSCGFIKVQQEGSVMAIIPFAFPNFKASKEMDFKTHDYLHQPHKLDKLIKSISNSEIISLDETHLEKQHEKQESEFIVNSGQLLEPYRTKIRIDCKLKG
jgi:DNA-binding NtrC family response regulator